MMQPSIFPRFPPFFTIIWSIPARMQAFATCFGIVFGQSFRPNCGDGTPGDFQMCHHDKPDFLTQLFISRACSRCIRDKFVLNRRRFEDALPQNDPEMALYKREMRKQAKERQVAGAKVGGQIRQGSLQEKIPEGLKSNPSPQSRDLAAGAQRRLEQLRSDARKNKVAISRVVPLYQ